MNVISEQQNDETVRVAGPDTHEIKSGANTLRRTRVLPQFTEGFGEWLLRHRVGLAVSTYRTGIVLFIGVDRNAQPVISAAGFPRAMGLWASPQRVYVGSKNEVWRLENVLEQDEVDSDTFDRLYVPRNAQITGEMDIHELHVEPDGRVIFANTRFSCLATLSLTHSFKPIWKPKFISRLAPEDRCHLNGLAVERGRVRYVSVCSTSDSVQGWRGNKRDGGAIIDVETDAVIDGLSMPHSPRVDGETILVLESGRGALVRIHRTTGKREDVAFCPGFARGLALVDHFAVVTISLPRIASFDGLPIADVMRAKGAVPWRGVLVINVRTGDIVEWMRLDGDVTELFDVAVIPGIRAPRALGSNSLSDVVRPETTGVDGAWP